MLVIIATGYFATKKGIFSAKARADVTNVVVTIIVPCNIFMSFSGDITQETLRQSVFVLVAGFGVHLIYILLSKLLYIRFEPEKRAVLKAATISNNAVFMGLPVIGAVFGPIGVIYGSIIMIPVGIFMWSIGLSQFMKTDKKETIKMLIKNPGLLAIVLGFAYALMPITLPYFLEGAILAFGRSTTALTMFIVGSILAGINFKTIFDKDGLYYSFIRLIAIPAMVFGLMTLVNADPLVRGVMTLSSAMPMAVVTVMQAEKSGRDMAFASKAMLMSTLLSIITLPIIAEILTYFGT